MTDPRRACRFEALALALRARTGMLWRCDVAVLQALCEPLEPDDQLRPAVVEFAACWGRDRWNRLAMAEAGAALQRAVERAGWPEAVAP